MKYIIPSLLIVSIFSSCFHTKKVIKKEVTLDTVTVSAKADMSDELYRASAPRIWDIVHSRVALTFNYMAKTANGREWITLHPYFYPTDTLTLDAKGMQIDEVLEKKEGGKKLNYTYADNLLKINFGHYYHAADTIELYIKYKAMPYATPPGGSSAITEDRGLYFINTDNKVKGKPVQIWTQGETESNSHWLPTIDKPNSRFTVQVELTIPDTFQTLSNGYLAKSIKEKDGLRTDIWKMDMRIQAYAVMFAIGKFSIIKNKWHGKDVDYYVEPEYAPYARDIFKNTPDMIEFFSQITGVPFPWNKYDQVIVRDYVSGAMENTTASLFGEFMNQNAREIADRGNEDVVSHELFHMWFGDYVTCESWSNLTLNESFANYGEQLWRGHKYGKQSVDEEGYNDLQKYIQFSKQSDKQLVRFYYDDREDMFDPISYEKGGATLKYLNNLLGDSAFYKAMKIYLTKNALHSAEATQWRLAVEEATGLDWNWFFNEWYYHAGHPVLGVNYKYDDSAKQLIVNVTQKQDDSTFVYKLPLKAALLYGSDKEIIDWDINKRKETFYYPYKNGIRPVFVPDYTHILPGELRENKEHADWLVQMKDCDDYVNQRKAIYAASQHLSDSVLQVVTDLGLKSNIASIRAYTLSLLAKKDEAKWHKKWEQQAEYMAINDADHRVRANAFYVLAEWKVASAKDIMLKAVWDSSYSVAGNALYGISKIDSASAYNIAKEILRTHPEGELMTYTWYIIGQRGNDDDIALFQDAAPYFYGRKKFQFASSLYYYEKHVKNIITFEQGLQIFRQLIKDENIKGYRIGFGSYVLELGKYYSDKKDKASQNRFSMVKDYMQKIIDEEPDESNVKNYKTMMKTYFPEEDKKTGGK